MNVHRPLARRSARRSRQRQRGVAALEFAIVLPVFFVIFYGLVTFALVLLAQHALTAAANEGARSALRFQPAATESIALAARSVEACSTANALVTWLPGTGGATSSVACAVTTPPCSYDATLVCMQVNLTYAYSANPLVPLIPFAVAVLPANLYGSAAVQINPINLTSS